MEIHKKSTTNQMINGEKEEGFSKSHGLMAPSPLQLERVRRGNPYQKTCFILLLFLLPFSLLAQKEASIWYFGYYAGLDFNNCAPVALTDGQMNQLEGCASIADSNGNLLFYTNGTAIYNANHQLMLNGNWLLGAPSSSQSAIIIPDPGSNDRYYIFTVAAFGGSDGLTYSVVDMSLDGGLGGVVPGEKNIQLATPVAEKLTATYHANGKDIWVIVHEMANNHFLSYLVTASGINPSPVVSAVGEIHLDLGPPEGTTGAIGYLKASPDGKRIACAKYSFNTGVEIFDFNNNTGVLSNPQKIMDASAYGVEFSPNSNLLYATANPGFVGYIYQYDISLPDLQGIKQSETIISNNQKYAALQLAVNGKIYVAQAEASGAPIYNTLSVINSPNNAGTACNFAEDAVSLGGKFSRDGLPPFIQDYFQYEISYSGNPCMGNTFQLQTETFEQPVNVSWDFGDPDSGGDNTDSGVSTSHSFSAPGIYTVTANLVNAVNCTISLTREINIYPIPELNQPENIVQCGIEVFDFTQIVPEMLGNNQNAGDFTITYYENQTDAEAGISGTEISNPETYEIENLPQQSIHVRVENEFGCYDTTSFDIIVNPKAEVDLSAYDGLSICVDLDPTTPTIGGNYEPITIDPGLSETDYVFSWSLNGEPLSETGSSIPANLPGEYTVTVTDITSTDPSCVATSSATILQSNPPEFDVEAVFFEGQIIISNVSGNGDYEFSTDQISWTDLGENTSMTLSLKQTGLVKVYGHDKNGCGTTVVEVWMIDYMKFFTPNQDGINDRWRVLGLEGREANLYVFDRYGKLLASLSPSGPGWNGLYNGKPMPANDYWFRLEYKSPEGTPKVFRENFSLIR